MEGASGNAVGCAGEVDGAAGCSAGGDGRQIEVVQDDVELWCSDVAVSDGEIHAARVTREGTGGRCDGGIGEVVEVEAARTPV